MLTRQGMRFYLKSRGASFVAFCFGIAWLLSSATTIRAATQSSAGAPAQTVMTTDLRKEVNDFLAKELGAHLSDIKTLEPPPSRVVGTPTSGEFSWGTFMYALARYANTTGQRQLAGRDLAKVLSPNSIRPSRYVILALT